MPLIEPGEPAPAFTLEDQRGEVHRLADHLGAPVILYFYPKDDTRDCTDEACQFRDALPRFRKCEITVFGVSPDDVASHAAFSAKHRLSFPILADDGARVSDRYGVWVERQSHGRKHMEVERTTYLIDGEGRVARRWDRVEVAGHADEVLNAARALNNSESGPRSGARAPDRRA